MIPEGTPKGYLCVPSIDEGLGASFDCSSWDSTMFNVVYCNMNLVGRYLDHVLLKNYMSDLGRFWFAFGRSSPQSSVWMSDTDWVIFDSWSRSLLKISKFEDLTFKPASEVPRDLITAADSAVHEYYTRCLSHGKWQRLSNDPKAASPPAHSPLGADSESPVTPLVRSSLEIDFKREGNKKRKHDPAASSRGRFASKPLEEGKSNVLILCAFLYI